MGTVGYAYAYSYPYGNHPSTSKAFPENRVYEQLLIRNKIKKIAFQHRLRVEQRFVRVNRPDNPTEQWEFRQRFRYMLRGDIPLPNKRLYVGLYDEVFINFGANRGNRYLDQNRAYGALGIKLSKFEKVEVGYMHQYIPQRNGLVVENNHTLQFALFSNRPFRSPTQLSDQTFSRACSKSASRSCQSSIPHETRTRPSPMPARSRSPHSRPNVLCFADGMPAFRRLLETRHFEQFVGV